jgi:hypothetical protein
VPQTLVGGALDLKMRDARKVAYVSRQAGCTHRSRSHADGDIGRATARRPEVSKYFSSHRSELLGKRDDPVIKEQRSGDGELFRRTLPPGELVPGYGAHLELRLRFREPHP